MNDSDSQTGFRKEIEIKPWGTIVIELCEGKDGLNELRIIYNGNFPENYRRNVETVLRNKKYLKNLSVFKVPVKNKLQ
jgi:hypothetical protein